MRGAPALSIQRLAGHEDLTTTLGYMHLAHGETERAIRLLDLPPPISAHEALLGADDQKEGSEERDRPAPERATAT